jgi:hypothetical protein
MFHMMDIRNAFVTEKDIDAAVELLKDDPAGHTPEELFKARKIVDATVHPDTKQKIFMPLRVSFIVPCNLLLDLGMLSARTTSGLVASQLANQTYNALHYYANRNASNAESITESAQGFIGATASSVSISVWLMRVSKSLSPQSSAILRRLIPFSAVAMADFFNLGIVRRNEYLQGVDIRDTSSGEVVGKSRLAGAYAVSSCIFGRIVVVVPILAVPPMAMYYLEGRYASRSWFNKGRLPMLMTMVGLSIQCFCPLVFGIFRQRAEVNVQMLEPAFHNIVNSKGQKVCTVSYNKGI